MWPLPSGKRHEVIDILDISHRGSRKTHLEMSGTSFLDTSDRTDVVAEEEENVSENDCSDSVHDDDDGDDQADHDGTISPLIYRTSEEMLHSDVRSSPRDSADEPDSGLTIRPSLSKLSKKNKVLSVSNHPHRVRFDTIEVREYARCASDNPSVSCGVPIGLDWTVAVVHPAIRIDEYEGIRSKDGSYQSSIMDFRLNAVEREEVLRYHCGYSRAKLKDLEDKVDKARKKREATVDSVKRGLLLSRRSLWFNRLLPSKSRPFR